MSPMRLTWARIPASLRAARLGVERVDGLLGVAPESLEEFPGRAPAGAPSRSTLDEGEREFAVRELDEEVGVGAAATARPPKGNPQDAARAPEGHLRSSAPLKGVRAQPLLDVAPHPERVDLRPRQAVLGRR